MRSGLKDVRRKCAPELGRWYALRRWGVQQNRDRYARRINLSAVSTLQELPLFDSRGAIHSQEADCDPALGSQAEDFAIAQLMVVIPTIKAWMKQRRELSGPGIYRSDVTAFELLQTVQHRARFSTTARPPCFTAIT
jgi:hypothetical protein